MDLDIAVMKQREVLQSIKDNKERLDDENTTKRNYNYIIVERNDDNTIKSFSPSLNILDEMRFIRCIEHKGKAKFITPFVSKLIEIAEVFGFEIPEGCGKKYKSKRVKTKKALTAQGSLKSSTWILSTKDIRTQNCNAD